MRVVSSLMGLLALLPAALCGEVTPPEFFVLKSKLVPGQTGKEAFNNLYMLPNEVPSSNLAAVFYPLNADGFFFSLEETNPPKAHGHKLYSLKYNSTSTGPTYRASMEFLTEVYAYWQPFQFIETTSAGNGKMESGFYINGTGTDAQLLWTDNYKTINQGDFQSWLICDWWFELPQLFFVTVYAPPVSSLKVPATCAAVTLQVIPLQA